MSAAKVGQAPSLRRALGPARSRNHPDPFPFSSCPFRNILPTKSGSRSPASYLEDEKRAMRAMHQTAKTRNTKRTHLKENYTCREL